MSQHPSGEYRSQPPEVVAGGLMVLLGGAGLVLWLALGLADHWTVAVPGVLATLGLLLLLG